MPWIEAKTEGVRYLLLTEMDQLQPKEPIEHQKVLASKKMEDSQADFLVPKIAAITER